MPVHRWALAFPGLALIKLKCKSKHKSRVTKCYDDDYLDHPKVSQVVRRSGYNADADNVQAIKNSIDEREDQSCEDLHKTHAIQRKYGDPTRFSSFPHSFLCPTVSRHRRSASLSCGKACKGVCVGREHLRLLFLQVCSRLERRRRREREEGGVGVSE